MIANAYQACDWIADEMTLPYIVCAFEEADHFNCEMILLKLEWENTAKYKCYTFAVYSPSRKDIENFKIKISKFTQLINWYSIPKSLFENAEEFKFDKGFGLIDGLIQYLKTSAQINRRIKQRYFENPVDDLKLPEDLTLKLQAAGFHRVGELIYGYDEISSMGIEYTEVTNAMKFQGFDDDNLFSVTPYSTVYKLSRDTLNNYDKEIPETVIQGKYPTVDQIKKALENFENKTVDFYSCGQELYILVQSQGLWARIGSYQYTGKDDEEIQIHIRGDYILSRKIVETLREVCGSLFLNGYNLGLELIMYR